MRHLFVLLIALPILAFGGCAKQGDPAAAAKPDHSAAIIAALAIAGPASVPLRDDAAADGKTWACVGWGAVAATAPTAAQSLALATAGEPLPLFPAISSTLAMCNLPEVDVPEAVVDGVAVVQEYIDQGYGAAMTLITLFAPGLMESNCYAFAVSDAIKAWQAVLVPAAVVSPESWTLSTPEMAIDYAACGEAVAVVEVTP